MFAKEYSRSTLQTKADICRILNFDDEFNCVDSLKSIDPFILRDYLRSNEIIPRKYKDGTDTSLSIYTPEELRHIFSEKDVELMYRYAMSLDQDKIGFSYRRKSINELDKNDIMQLEKCILGLKKVLFFNFEHTDAIFDLIDISLFLKEKEDESTEYVEKIFPNFLTVRDKERLEVFEKDKDRYLKLAEIWRDLEYFDLEKRASIKHLGVERNTDAEHDQLDTDVFIQKQREILDRLEELSHLISEE